MGAPTLLGNANQQREVLTIHYWKLGLFFLLGGLYIPFHAYYFNNTQALDGEGVFAMIVITIISLSLILSKKEVVLDRARRKIFRNTLFSKWEANFNDVRAISTSVSKSHSNSWCVLVDTDIETDFELLCSSRL